MKKLKFLFLFSIAVIFSSCSNNGTEDLSEINDTNNLKSNYGFQMICEHDSITDIYQGESITSFLKWDDYIDNKLIMSANIIFDLSYFADAVFTYNPDTSITVRTKEDLYYINNLNYKDSVLSFCIVGQNNKPVFFQLSGKNYDFSNYLSPFNQKFPWVVVYGAACLIAMGIDYYCDRKIQKDVAACTAEGKCSQVNSCGATCVTCPK